MEMERAVLLAITGCMLICFTSVGIAVAQKAEDIDPQALIRQVETQYQGKTSYATMHMKIVTDAWSRELVMESWSEGRDKFLARILSPKKEEGTASLKIEDDMWNYLPKIDRLMKIPSSLMGDSWMGSHLTNDDLVKENKIDELYTFAVGKVEDSVATIICTPKSDAAIVWDKVEYQVDLTKIIPVNVYYYDEDGDLVRTMIFDKVENIDGRWIPLRMGVQPVDKPNEMTELVYENLKFDIKLPDDFFSLRSLRRR
ncbi:MAG: outer membrane lipoprotein-sorting protein [Candidatus Latescibacteria bacterium]|nr:outer membrane lipoprotein-sorting protein [Candidatus Latescibacterota bacterium]